MKSATRTNTILLTFPINLSVPTLLFLESVSCYELSIPFFPLSLLFTNERERTILKWQPKITKRLIILHLFIHQKLLILSATHTLHYLYCPCSWSDLSNESSTLPGLEESWWWWIWWWWCDLLKSHLISVTLPDPKKININVLHHFLLCILSPLSLSVFISLSISFSFNTFKFHKFIKGFVRLPSPSQFLYFSLGLPVLVTVSFSLSLSCGFK